MLLFLVNEKKIKSSLNDAPELSNFTANELRKIRHKSDTIIEGVLILHWLLGLVMSFVYDTWLIGLGVGSTCVAAYYLTKWIRPTEEAHRHVLAVIFAIFTAQYIYQMHGLFEMHFFVFIASALLITYQNWRLQLPLIITVAVHHGLFAYLQFAGSDIYFTQLDYMQLSTFLIHVALAAALSFISGVWAYNMKYKTIQEVINQYEIKQQSERIQTLLRASQEQNIQLQETQEEIKQNLEELQAIQEQVEYKNRQLDNLLSYQKAILSNAGVMVIVTDINGLITDINPAAEKTLGYRVEDIRGKFKPALLHDPDELQLKKQKAALALGIPPGEKIPDNILSLQQQAGITEDEWSFIRKDGSRLPVMLTRSAIRNEEGELLGYLGIASDITKIKESEKELSKVNDRISKLLQDVTSSINYARRIQKALLPHRDLVKQAFPESFVYYQPRDIVSGDFYWVLRRRNVSFLAVADCTGHGVPGAFMSTIGIELLNRIVGYMGLDSPEHILFELNMHLRQTLKQDETELRDGMDISLCVLDNNSRQLSFAGAKQSLYYIEPDGQLIEVRGDRQSIGGSQNDDIKEFSLHQIQLSPGSVFYLTTDGYRDQFSDNQDGLSKFGSSRFRKLLNEMSHRKMDEQWQILDNTMQNWLGNRRQIDDILVAGCRV